MNSEITVHCLRCGNTFSASYIMIEKWHYRCPKCREDVKPQRIIEPEEDSGDEDQEEQQ